MKDDTDKMSKSEEAEQKAYGLNFMKGFLLLSFSGTQWTPGVPRPAARRPVHPNHYSHDEEGHISKMKLGKTAGPSGITGISGGDDQGSR